MKTRRKLSDDVAEQLRNSLPSDAPPGLLHDAIATALVALGEATDDDSAAELAEPLIPGVQLHLGAAQTEAERLGVAWHLELYGSDDEYIRGSSFGDTSLPQGDQTSRANRHSLQDVKAALISIKATEFEEAGTSILRLLGCTNPRTTTRTGDGGIDFYGELKLQGRFDSKLPLGGIDRRVNVWLIGQAKHYPHSEVGPGAIREMVGSVDLVRTKGALRTWPDLHVHPYDPIVQLFFTTGRYSRDAKYLLSKSGMIAMDGNQLATLLCDLGVGFDANAAFDSQRFRNELLPSSK